LSCFCSAGASVNDHTIYQHFTQAKRRSSRSRQPTIFSAAASSEAQGDTVMSSEAAANTGRSRLKRSVPTLSEDQQSTLSPRASKRRRSARFSTPHNTEQQSAAVLDASVIQKASSARKKKRSRQSEGLDGNEKQNCGHGDCQPHGPEASASCDNTVQYDAVPRCDATTRKHVSLQELEHGYDKAFSLLSVAASHITRALQLEPVSRNDPQAFLTACTTAIAAFETAASESAAALQACSLTAYGDQLSSSSLG